MKHLYHFSISSGNEVMYRSEDDYIRAFNCFAIALYRTDSKALAEAFMTNHLHACVETADIKGVIFQYRAMYSRYFNHKYHRRGPLGERHPFVLDIVGVYHRLAALSYTLRNPLHHGIAATPFAYDHSSANAIFRKELGKPDITDLLSRNKYYRYLPDKAEIPSHYRMSANGILLRESVLDIPQAEYFYNTPRNYLFYMNRLSGEEWDKEQSKDNHSPITLNDIEKSTGLQAISSMLRNEHGRENYRIPSDTEICQIIDHEYLPQLGVQSVYQLSERQKQQIGNDLIRKFHINRAKAARCLIML